MGGRKDMLEMLQFAAAKGIRPQCETMPLSQANEAIAKMRANKVRVWPGTRGMRRHANLALALHATTARCTRAAPCCGTPAPNSDVHALQARYRYVLTTDL